jgi:hypothetical protein
MVLLPMKGETRTARCPFVLPRLMRDRRPPGDLRKWSVATGDARSNSASIGGRLSAYRVTIECMEMTARAVEGIPRGNLHVSRDEFVARWRLVEHLGEADPADRYVAGVAATCRWLARAAVPSIPGGWQLARAPATRRSNLAHEELIEAELLAAELQLLRVTRHDRAGHLQLQER